MLRILARLLLGPLLASAALPDARADDAAGVPVLIYHQIVSDGTPAGETVITLERFREQMDHLAAQRYTTLSMAELVGYLRGTGKVPPKAVVLSFDDGWKSVLNAVPVLERHRFKASFWIITRKGIGWSNLEWADVQALDAHPLFEVGSHTASHPWDPADNLVTWVDGRNPGKGAREAIAELQVSRADLEQRLGRPIDMLAWPCGWYNDELTRMAGRAGYRAALTTEDGLNRRGDDPMRIKRTFIDGACGMEEFKAALRTGRYQVCQKSAPPTLGNSPYR
jgi:peptidoglycan/xylan/chitin deacetylase (PgdA/CDA1 family)